MPPPTRARASGGAWAGFVHLLQGDFCLGAEGPPQAPPRGAPSPSFENAPSAKELAPPRSRGSLTSF
eukprot:9100337-Pyramimonas_sp.AAC.1